MKTLVLYDSQFGNTEQVARAIAAALGEGVSLKTAATVQPADIAAAQLLIVGAPTQGGRPTPPVLALLKSLTKGTLSGKAVAAFDTRLDSADQTAALRLLMRVIGYAAPRIGKGLVAAGGKQAAAPEGFIVDGKEGPLRAGELERAAAWAQKAQQQALVAAPAGGRS